MFWSARAPRAANSPAQRLSYGKGSTKGQARQAAIGGQFDDDVGAGGHLRVDPAGQPLEVLDEARELDVVHDARPAGSSQWLFLFGPPGQHLLERRGPQLDEHVDPLEQVLIVAGEGRVDVGAPAAIQVGIALQFVGRRGQRRGGLWPGPHTPSLEDDAVDWRFDSWPALRRRTIVHRLVEPRQGDGAASRQAIQGAKTKVNVVSARGASGNEQGVDALGERRPL